MAMEADKTKLKRICVDELKVGKFIVNMGASWIFHPFLRSQLKIGSPKKIEKLKRYGIQEVYIDPRRGQDVPPPKVEEKVTVHSEGEESNLRPELSNIRPSDPKPLSLHAPSPPPQAPAVSG